MESEEASQIINWVIKGHSVFFTGSAGTGKTTLIKKIVEMIPRTVAVTTSTGIAASQYTSASTIHRFTGIKTGTQRLSTTLRYVNSRKEVKERILSTDVLIIDEISMISSQTFNLINDVLQSIRSSTEVFGGMQIVACGDFKQLPPVRSPHDNAEYCFTSELWNRTFTHTTILKTIYRQNDPQFINILTEISNGQCSKENRELLKNRTKPLSSSDFGLEFIPAIYTHNTDVQHHNMTQLIDHPGQVYTFTAKDTGSKSLLNKRTIADSTLHLKVGSPVMLIYNCTNELTNGMTGTVTEMKDGLPVVHFPRVNKTVRVEQKIWHVASDEDPETVVATRIQIPLKLAWAFTVHKSQGLSLEAAEIHCRQVFAPGHLYVAMSRLRSMNGLRLVGFNDTSLMSPPVEVANFLECVSSNRPYRPLHCHRVQITTDMIDTTEDWGDDDDDDDTVATLWADKMEEEMTIDQPSTTEEVTPLDILEESDDYFSRPPFSFCVKTFLTTLKDDSVFAKMQQSSAYHVNAIIENLKKPERVESVENYIRHQWCKIYKILQANCKGAPDQQGSHDRKSFTAHLQELHEHITQDKTLDDFMNVCRQPRTLYHIECLSTILMEVNRLIIKEIADIVRAERGANTTADDTDEAEQNSNDSSKAKVRYVGGWVIAKTVKKYRKYLVENGMSLQRTVRQKLQTLYSKKLVVESLVCTSQYVHENTSYQDSLSVTDYKQYRQGGLFHITDAAYSFFVSLEKERVALMSSKSFNEHKSQLVIWVLDCLHKNSSLREEFMTIVEATDDMCHGGCITENGKIVIHEVYQDILQRYINMGVGQFLRDIRCELHLQKTEAHRRKVMQREQKATEKSKKVTNEEMKNDRSEGKEVTHRLMIAKVTENPKYFTSRLYTKDEIKSLFGLYDLRYMQSYTKNRLNDLLVNKIKNCTRMPKPERL
ncbi:uncharacterized protein LOC144451879 [Glandiceps talaboti]